MLRVGGERAARRLLAIINGMVPLWAAVIAVPVLKERLGPVRIAGFVLGIAGVALIVNLGPVES